MANMLTHSVWISVLASVVACTGSGIDRSDAVPLRTTLEIRPIRDGDPYEAVLADTAQGARPLPEHVSPHAPLEVEVQRTERTSASSPPVPVIRIHARSREMLEQLVTYSEPAPSGRAVVYEPQPDERWEALVVDTTQGMVLGSDTGLKLAPGAAGSDLHGVFLLLPRDEAASFELLTRQHDGSRLAIIDDDEVLVSVMVTEPISGGDVLISPGTDGSAAAMFERLAGQPPR